MATDKTTTRETASHDPPPPPANPPTPSPQPPPHPAHIPSIPFATVIEADHATLSTLALSIFSPTISAPTRLDLLTTLLWRLIRHDISEELVMRPAFVRYMGDEGARLAEHDRQDHREIKRKLLAVVGRVEGADQGWLVDELRALSRGMAEHMREESGVVVPRFVGLVSEETAGELGRRYVASLVLTPGWAVGDGGEGGVVGGGEAGWGLGDVVEYANTDVEVFRTRLERLESRAVDGVDGGFLQGRVREELERIGLGLGGDSGQHGVVQSGIARGKL